MSRDQLQILESSANRKASVSPSPNTTRGLADLNLTGSEDQTDTSLEPGETRGGQVTCLDNFPDSLQPGEFSYHFSAQIYRRKYWFYICFVSEIRLAYSRYPRVHSVITDLCCRGSWRQLS